MCGIAGAFAFGQGRVERDALERMSRCIAHRGPDGHGMYEDGPVGLAHRRLAIIDLSASADQPMAAKEGRLQIVFNGEIYNYRELRGELETLGHMFRTHSDTEVILEAYREWPTDYLLRLNGIFAFALWDGTQQTLTLARDRLGVKPLYYSLWNGYLVFGSEVKALTDGFGVPVRLNHQALNDYFTFQNILTDETLFDGVRILPAGEVLMANEGGVRRRQYWDLEWQKISARDDEWPEIVSTTFRQAVARQLVSDVQVGSFLSGGMDSASIAAVARRHLSHLTTFTGGFDLSGATGREAGFDERADAEVVAAALGSEHYEMVLHAQDMRRALPSVIWHLEDLRVGMCYQNFYVARLASRFLKVNLSGVGGDELFAGYPWRYALCLEAESEEGFERDWYSYWCRLMPDDRRAGFFSPSLRSQLNQRHPYESYRAVMEKGKGLSRLDQAFAFELRTFLHGLLVVEDKVTMANALEVRVPFLDNDLVDVALSIPAHLKLREGEGKWVLRRAAEDILPSSIVNKKKQGFSPPEGSWYRGENSNYLRSLLLGPRARGRDIFDPAAVERIVDQHLTGEVDQRLLLWSFVSFEWWCRLFLDGDRPCVNEGQAATDAPCDDLCLHDRSEVRVADGEGVKVTV